MDKLAEGMRRRQKNQLYKDYGIDVPESEKDVGDEITGFVRFNWFSLTFFVNLLCSKRRRCFVHILGSGVIPRR